MNKPSKVIRARNETIRARFGQHLQQGMPTMLAYTNLSHEFDLSEVQIRRIIQTKIITNGMH